MTLLVDLFGFLSVMLRGLGLALAAVAVGGVVFRHAVLARANDALRGDTTLARRLRRLQAWAALGLVGAVAAGRGLDLAILIDTVGVPWTRALSAPFALAGFATCAGGLLLAALATRPVASPVRDAAAALLILGGLVATTHATGRIDDRLFLQSVSVLHQAGGMAWIGGLPHFLIALRAGLPPAAMAALGAAYSRVCVLAVAAILASAVAKYVAYLGAPDALYGTAYGLMTGTKAAMFCALLAFGAGNFHAVRRLAQDPRLAARTQRFVEVELAIGIGLYFVAGSLTSLPPAVDLPDARVAWPTIVERVLTPKLPRLHSPDHSELWYETAQARLDLQAAARREQAPRAFVPGAGIVYTRSAADIAWSEYNHNWSGVFVFTIGVLALLARHPRCRFARHWPVLFVILGVFIAIRADPESWPLGSIGFFEAFREPGVVQHRLMTLLVVLFGLFEWRSRVGGLAQTRAVYVFPITNVLGGIFLLTHSHVLENIQEALLIEMSHIPIGLLAIAAGCARWLELRAGAAAAARTGLVWPLAFAGVGLVLMFYREA